MEDWGNRAAWRVLDTHFQEGAGFAALWATWEHDPQRPRVLHYVAILPAPPDLAHLRRHLLSHGPLATHAAAMQQTALPDMPDMPDMPAVPALSALSATAGFQRLEFAAGQVLLTLCIGPLQAMLRAQEFVADAIHLGLAPGDSPTGTWDAWAIKSLARLCRRGTTVRFGFGTTTLMPAFQKAGFEPEPAGTGLPGTAATYTPRWDPGTSRQAWRKPPPPPAHCLVLGAGLAGASVAASLARRGWSVTVLDAARAPAAGASALPAGLLVPQVSRDDGARSRLSRAGVHLTLQWCRTLLQEGKDWAHSGVRERLWDDSPGGSIWHADGAWIKPARLVAACLSAPGIAFVGGARVHRLQHAAGQWAALDAGGNRLGQAPHLVLAAAGVSPVLLASCRDPDGRPLAGQLALREMQPVQGQVSWGYQAADDCRHFPTHPVNGHGHLLPAVPLERGVAWFAGATYEPASSPALDEQIAHAENRLRLRKLLPEAESALAQRFDQALVQSWRGTRSTTHDRLPGAGPLQQGNAPNLWMSAGMGSRGLTYAPLCAELLAARMGGEPLPVESSLARLLAATRPGLSHHL